MRTHKLAAPAVVAVVAALVLMFAHSQTGSTAPTSMAAEPVPTCAKPTSNVTHQKVVDYVECLQRRTEALLANLGAAPAPSTTPEPSPTPTPTPQPTPTPEPEPAPTPTPTPEPSPTPTEFPNASNTGIPAGTTLTAYTGPMVITTAGTVIDSETITGDLRIQAPGVLVKRSKINGDVRIDAGDTGYSFRIEDSEVNAGRPLGQDSYDGTGIGARDFVAVRVNVYGGKRGINCFKDCTVRDSYVHMSTRDDTGQSHQSGIRMGSGSQIIHNTILCDAPDVAPDAGCSAGLTGYGDFAPVQNNLIQDNYFPASTGGACAYGGSSAGKPYSAATRDIRFVDNVFEHRATSQRGTTCGYYFTIADFDPSRPGNVWTGNRYTDGAVVNP